jgi:hypothetical protein
MAGLVEEGEGDERRKGIRRMYRVGLKPSPSRAMPLDFFVTLHLATGNPEVVQLLTNSPGEEQNAGQLLDQVAHH